MGSLAALLVATPVFGFALSPPQTASPLAVQPMPRSVSQLVDRDLERGMGEGSLAGREEAEIDRLRARRMRLARVHKGLGLATWAAMTATIVVGAVRFHDQYGAFEPYDETPCARGEAVLGEAQCDVPYAHLSLAIVTAVLYGTTMGLAAAMPNPDDAGSGSGRAARRLRLHRLLRWVHLAGMIGQMVNGILSANLDAMGVDPEENHRALQAYAAVHMFVGLATWGTLTAAGLLMAR